MSSSATFASLQQPSRHAQYGEHWGEGAARCFSIEADILDEDHAVRLMPVPDSFVCPISAAIMVDPVATVDGCVYERSYIERWFRERRQQGHRITSPITGLELPSATLMPLVALQRAIEAYLAHRPELKRDHMAGRSFEEAAQILQTDLFEKQAVHASTQDKVKRLRQENKALLRALHEAEARILQLEGILSAASSAPSSSSSSASATSVTGSVLSTGPSVSEVGTWTGSQSSSSSISTATCSCYGAKDLRYRSVSAGFAAGAVATACLLTSLIMLSLPARLVVSSNSSHLLPPLPAARLNSELQHDQRRDDDSRTEISRGSTLAPNNPAFASQLEHLRNGSPEEKQRAVFMLRIFAAEQSENQVAIADAGAIEPLVTLLDDPLPTLREESARALWNLARNNREINVQNQVAIGKAGAITPLIHLLEDDEPRVRVVAAAVLNDLAADNTENQIAISRAGAIDPLVKILKNDEAPALVMAASLLKNLAASSSDGEASAALLAAVTPLVALLRGDTLLAQEQAASTLGAFAAHSLEMKAALASAGAIPPLVDRLNGDMMQGTAAVALRNLAADHPENQVAIAQAGAILPLVKLLEDGMPLVREEAAKALWNLAKDNVENQVAIVQAGAAIPLVALLKGDAQEQATLTLLRVSEQQ